MVKMDGMTIAARLTQVREAAGFTQEELAEAAGVPQTSISRIERGETENPGVILMAKIAAALGVPIDQLVSEPTLPQDRLAKAETKAAAAARMALQGELTLAQEIQELRDRVTRLERRPAKRQAEG